MKRNGIILIVLALVAVFAFTACGTAETVQDNMEKEAMAQEPVESQEVVDPDNPVPLAASNKTRNPEEIFRFETTALQGEGGETINPNGMLLNIGCEDCQDIFYASRTLTVPEVIEKLKSDFGVEEMLTDENFVRFDINIDLVRKLEIELNLIAAKKLTVGNEIVDIRIISIAPDGE